jgi:hypothetical protein
VIARGSFGKLRACPEQSVGINSTTEAIPFLEAMLLRLHMSYESIRFRQNLGNKHKEGNLILKRRFYMSKSPVLQG